MKESNLTASFGINGIHEQKIPVSDGKQSSIGVENNQENFKTKPEQEICSFIKEKATQSYIWLETVDGELEQVESEVALLSPLIQKEVLHNECHGSSRHHPILLPKPVSAEILALILEYGRFHRVQGRSDKERKLFDEKFIRLDTRQLCVLTSAADSLDMKALVDLTSRALARMIEGKTPEEIRETFHLPDDLTEEEKLEPVKNVMDDPRIRLLNRLYARKRKELQDKKLLKSARMERGEERPPDERSVDELLNFIDGGRGNGEVGKSGVGTEKKKKKKNKKKTKERKREKESGSKYSSGASRGVSEATSELDVTEESLRAEGKGEQDEQRVGKESIGIRPREIEVEVAADSVAAVESSSKRGLHSEAEDFTFPLNADWQQKQIPGQSQKASREIGGRLEAAEVTEAEEQAEISEQALEQTADSQTNQEPTTTEDADSVWVPSPLVASTVQSGLRNTLNPAILSDNANGSPFLHQPIPPFRPMESEQQHSAWAPTANGMQASWSPPQTTVFADPSRNLHPRDLPFSLQQPSLPPLPLQESLPAEVLAMAVPPSPGATSAPTPDWTYQGRLNSASQSGGVYLGGLYPDWSPFGRSVESLSPSSSRTPHNNIWSNLPFTHNHAISHSSPMNSSNRVSHPSQGGNLPSVHHGHLQPQHPQTHTATPSPDETMEFAGFLQSVVKLLNLDAHIEVALKGQYSDVGGLEMQRNSWVEQQRIAPPFLSVQSESRGGSVNFSHCLSFGTRVGLSLSSSQGKQ